MNICDRDGSFSSVGGNLARSCRGALWGRMIPTHSRNVEEERIEKKKVLTPIISPKWCN